MISQVSMNLNTSTQILTYHQYPLQLRSLMSKHCQVRCNTRQGQPAFSTISLTELAKPT